MRMENGAAAISQSSQVIDLPSCFSMKPIATMFCAAAVLMPTFQMLAVCAVVIISMPANALVLLTPNAAMMPSMIGTRQETRAVVLGTMKASTMPTSIDPMTTARVSVPTRARMLSAMRRSRPVIDMAAARNSAAATSAKAVLAKPENAMPSARLVPIRTLGLATSGDSPSRNAIRAAIITAETA